MLVDHRIYRILPGRVPAQLELYGRLAYPVQLRHLGEPHYYLVSETGQLNTFVHGWVYENAADREQKRSKMAQDPDWKHFLVENAKAGNIIEQSNWMMAPAPFAPKIPSAKIVK
jgi:NIPSNAP